MWFLAGRGGFWRQTYKSAAVLTMDSLLRSIHTRLRSSPYCQVAGLIHTFSPSSAARIKSHPTPLIHPLFIPFTHPNQTYFTVYNPPPPPIFLTTPQSNTHPSRGARLGRSPAKAVSISVIVCTYCIFQVLFLRVEAVSSVVNPRAGVTFPSALIVNHRQLFYV